MSTGWKFPFGSTTGEVSAGLRSALGKFLIVATAIASFSA
jgi:hypothetical protein